MSTQKISNKEKLSYGIGALGKDMAYAIVGSFFMLYCTDVLGLGAGFVGLFVFAARFWDAINDLMMGVIVDNTKTRWGKFRPWLLIGTILNSFVIIILFADWGISGKVLATVTVILYVLWGMTYTIMDIPYWAMLSNFSTDKEEREKIVVIPRIFASLGGLTVGSFGLKIIDYFGNTGGSVGDTHKGYFLFSILISVIFIITILITCFNVKSADGISNGSNMPAEKTTFKKMLEVITKNDQLLIAILSILTFNFATQMMGAISTYYFIYVAGSEGLFGIFTLFAGISEITGLFLFPKLSKKITRKQCYLIASTVPILGFILLGITGFIAPQNAILTAISGILIKFGSGLQLGVVTIVLADVVDYGEYKFDSRNEGVTFSLQTLLVKLTSAFSVLIGGFVLELTGYVPNAVQSESTLNAMRFAMCVLPSIFIVISFIIYKTFYKLEGKFFENILNVLALKREAKEKAFNSNQLQDTNLKDINLKDINLQDINL